LSSATTLVSMQTATGVWPSCRFETNPLCWARQSVVVGRQHSSRIGFRVATDINSNMVDFYSLVWSLSRVLCCVGSDSYVATTLGVYSIQIVQPLAAHSLQINRGRTAGSAPPLIGEVKNAWICIFIVQYITCGRFVTHCKLSSVMDFRSRILWFSVSYSRFTDALFTTIFPLSEAAFAAASHNARWRYKFQKQIYLVVLFIASYGTVECEFKLVYLESNAFKMWRSYEFS